MRYVTPAQLLEVGIKFLHNISRLEEQTTFFMNSFLLKASSLNSRSLKILFVIMRRTTLCYFEKNKKEITEDK